MLELWRRAETERVEVACTGGRGRTGTALACMAVLDGVPATDAGASSRSTGSHQSGHLTHRHDQEKGGGALSCRVQAELGRNTYTAAVPQPASTYQPP